MNYTIQEHEIASVKIAEVMTDEILVNTSDDALQLLGDLYYSGFDVIVLHQQNIVPDFFDLKTGMAGEILQKFSNYRMRLFIIGEFTSVSSKSLTDFIRESNKGKLVHFSESIADALSYFSI